MSDYRIFLASPKATSRDLVDRDLAFIAEKFAEVGVLMNPDLKVTVTAAEDDFRDHFSRCGGWTEWATDVGTGVDYMFRTPRYNAIVVTTERVGKATAQIVESALGARRMVTLLRPDRSFERIRSVEVVDAENWQEGWKMSTAE